MGNEKNPLERPRKIPGYVVLPMEKMQMPIIMLGRRMALREVVRDKRLLLRLLPKLLKWALAAIFQRLRRRKAPPPPLPYVIDSTPMPIFYRTVDTFLPRSDLERR